MEDKIIKNNESYSETKKVTFVSIVLNLLLMAYKIVIGYIGNSSAVIADGVHSLSDFFTDIIVIIGVRVSIKPEDEEHPYGHGKVETFVSLTIASILVFVAVGIIYNSLSNIIGKKELEPPQAITLTAVLLSIIVKKFLFRYTITAGKKHKLNSLIANAWHHRSDVYSSFAALGGVIGAMMGYSALDPIAAGVVAFLIGKAGVDIGRESFMDLIDTAADKKTRNRIERIIRDMKEVVSYHDFKTRKIGNRVISELHIEVNPSISVVEGHSIAKNLKEKIVGSVEEVGDILIHVEPTGDRDGIVYGVDKDKIHENVVKVCENILGIKGLHSLKVHHFGSDIVLNIDIEVAPSSTVAESHIIAKEVKQTLLKLSDDIKDVVVHIDPYKHSK
jgi:cation diffusion facilitator family transporter